MGNTELRLIDWIDSTKKYFVTCTGEIFRKLLNAPRERQLIADSSASLFLIDGTWYKRIKPYNRPKGYLAVEIGGKMQFAHRLVAKAFIPNVDNKPQVNHKDGNPQNNCIDNLEWCTNQENANHSFEVLGRKPSFGGRGKKGYKDPKTAVLYDRIQYLLETTMHSKAEIAKLCGCKYAVVKSCHSIRKVQRLSNYNFRTQRFKI